MFPIFNIFQNGFKILTFVAIRQPAPTISSHNIVDVPLLELYLIGNNVQFYFLSWDQLHGTFILYICRI